MEQSPSRNTESCSACEEIFRSLLSPKISFRAHRSRPPSQMNSIHIFEICFLNPHFSIINPSDPFLSGFRLKFFMHFSLMFPMNSIFLVHFSLSDLI